MKTYRLSRHNGSATCIILLSCISAPFILFKSPILPIFHDKDDKVQNISSREDPIFFPANLNQSSPTIIDNSARENPDIALFYNVFIPSGKNQRALEITRSQMDYIKESTVNITKVLCNLITERDSEVPGCNDMTNCFVMKKVNKGDETLTLLDLYHYCLKNATSTVVYIHNKGSFHDSPQNNGLREMHMRALVRTDSCLKSVASGACNVCSARFSPIPHFHAPGNMWIAHCSYVENLISPLDFEGRMNAMITSLEANQTLLKEMFPCKEENGVKVGCKYISHVGLGRYAAEHWIHSHPNVVPCDVLPQKYRYAWGYGNIPSASEKWEPDIHVGPRFARATNSSPTSAKWLSLEGRLFEWKQLYNSSPASDSWVWKFYANDSLLRWCNIDFSYPSVVRIDSISTWRWSAIRVETAFKNLSPPPGSWCGLYTFYTLHSKRSGLISRFRSCKVTAIFSSRDEFSLRAACICSIEFSLSLGCNIELSLRIGCILALSFSAPYSDESSSRPVAFSLMRIDHMFD